MKKLDNKGFSLVELIIVIAIMAVLIGVLAPQFLRYVERSRYQKDVSAISELRNATEIALANESIAKDVIAAAVADRAVAVTTNAAAATSNGTFLTSIASLQTELAAAIGSNNLRFSSERFSTATDGSVNLTITVSGNTFNVKANYPQ